MATWSCGHRRAQLHKILANSADDVLIYGARNADTALWRGLFADELRDRYLPCPACRASEAKLGEDRKKLRHGYAGLGLVGLALFVLGMFTTCNARAADACAPYSPTDGRTCEPPARLREWRGMPICVCAPKELVRR
jgi:hypothetical protein